MNAVYLVAIREKALRLRAELTGTYPLTAIANTTLSRSSKVIYCLDGVEREMSLPVSFLFESFP